MTQFTHTVRGVLYDDEHGRRRFKPLNENEKTNLDRLFMRGNPGEEWIMAAKPYRSKHSPSQRGYLHGCVIPEMLKAMGHEDSTENHAAMYLKIKEKFGQSHIVYGKDGEAGEVLILPKSMSGSDTAEMHQLIEGAIRWAGEFLGLTIPPPSRVVNSGDGGGI